MDVTLLFGIVIVFFVFAYSFLHWRYTQEKKMVDKYVELWYTREVKLAKLRKFFRKRSVTVGMKTDDYETIYLPIPDEIKEILNEE